MLVFSFHKYPSFIASNYRIQQIWFIFNAFQNVPKQNSLRRSVSSSDSTFGTSFTQTFLMCNSSVRIRRNCTNLNKLTSSATARTHSLRSFPITSRTFSVLSSVTAFFQAFSAFRKSFVPFRHACTEHAIFTREPQSIIEKFPYRISSV